VLGTLTVGVGGAQDERPGVQPAVALPGLVERATEGSVRQVVQDRVAAEDIADGPALLIYIPNFHLIHIKDKVLTYRRERVHG
jgi:hypothetical protein